MQVDFRPLDNPTCRHCRNAQERKACAPQGICQAASSILDGGPLRCVGEWGREKAYNLAQYLGVFCQGMRKLWKGLNYIEICSGPGRCLDYHSFTEHDGSSIVVLRHRASIFLTTAMFIDNDEASVSHLQKRIDNIGITNARASIADYTDPGSVVKALEGLPPSCLNLLFIDPTNLDFPFESLVAITKHLGQTDIIMTVAMGMDFNRNADKALLLV